MYMAISTSSGVCPWDVPSGLDSMALISRFLMPVITSDLELRSLPSTTINFFTLAILRSVKCVAPGVSACLRRPRHAMLRRLLTRRNSREIVRRGDTKRVRCDGILSVGVHFSEFVFVISSLKGFSACPGCTSALGTGTGILLLAPISWTVSVKTVWSIALTSWSISSRIGKKESTIESRMVCAIQSV